MENPVILIIVETVEQGDAEQVVIDYFGAKPFAFFRGQIQEGFQGFI